MVSFPYSITICYLGTKGMVPLHWVIGVKTYFFSACSLFSPMIKTQILEVWQGEIASFPTLPSPGYLLFLQENEKKKPQAIWFLEASMCIDPITSKVKLSHNWPHSQHRVSSPSSATFLIISKGFFFFFTVISIEFTFSALPMFSQFWTDSMEHQASEWWMDQTRSTIG